jgi:DNA-binding GntR family transcriptional regulator
MAIQTTFLSKSDLAYEEIKRRILSDQLPPGAVISQERLATEMSLSTTPVREALKRLKAEGLVRLDAHRDARVAELSADEARSLYEVRQSLDPMAASLAAERRTDREVEQIELAMSVLHPLTDTADMAALIAHREFHRAIYRASQNALLIEVLEGLWDKADRYRQAGLKAERDSDQDVERVQAEHRALADAVIAGDPQAADTIMRTHIEKSLGRRAITALDG